MSRFTKRDRYGHAYTNETIYDRGMTSKDGKTYEKHYFENGTSAYDGKPIDRLCEIEDKIKQGELVEVVRCRDCKFWGGTTYGFVCRKLSGIDTKICMGADHYCSYGERSENET